MILLIYLFGISNFSFDVVLCVIDNEHLQFNITKKLILFIKIALNFSYQNFVPNQTGNQ